MIAEYIQDCSSGSPLLDYYAEREYHWQNAGKEIKKAIEANGTCGYFPFSYKNLCNKVYFKVQRMRYQGELYAVVTNSCINYIFKITP